MVWVLLLGAILSEVSATVSLRLSEGFSKAVPSTVVVVGYLLSFALLAQVLKRGLPVGVAYAIWSALGVALVAVIGAAFLREPLSRLQVAGLVLVILGVIAVQSGTQAG
jgi:small multidrug resistance pump